MGLPSPKVAKVPGVTYQRWPARLQDHDRVVNPDRKEDDTQIRYEPSLFDNANSTQKWLPFGSMFWSN